jgi:hypothetical protein
METVPLLCAMITPAWWFLKLPRVVTSEVMWNMIRTKLCLCIGSVCIFNLEKVLSLKNERWEQL